MTFQLIIWIAAIAILLIISNSLAHAAGAKEAKRQAEAYSEGYIQGYLEGESKGAKARE